MSRRRPVLRDFERDALVGYCERLNELLDAEEWLQSQRTLRDLTAVLARCRGPARKEAEALTATARARWDAEAAPHIFGESLPAAITRNLGT